MPKLLQTIPSVTRWLIVVVVGCAVLETVQPMSAAEPSASPADARSADTVLYPKDSPARPASASTTDEGRGGSWMLAGALLLAMGGGWMLIRRRGMPLARVGRTDRLIRIEETKSLGNRQYLVVAGCEGRRFLLGVTAGQIQMLSSLDENDDTPEL
ncbi:flagellar biosynthetic protein FliO [Rariglobus hedericola]|uniref:FliO/MopB family protein n=1 Tax=Rariglobus hedericola TaxID=2597822 RepID=UPI0011842BD0